MAKNISIVSINAPVEKVWDTVTNPELVKLWQFGSDLVTTWTEGDSIRFSVSWEGKLFEQWGTVLEVKPLQYLKYNLFAPRPGLADSPENYFMMTYLFKVQNGQTVLEIIQDDDRPGAVQEAVQGEENPVLQSLKTTAETAR